MGRFLVVSKAERLEEYRQIAKDYDTGFEINDFYDPDVLDDGKQCQSLIDAYLSEGLPEGSTMHGAFFDITIFSYDAKIRAISRQRMKQSMEIARKLGVKGVVFHTNYNPILNAPEYDTNVVRCTVNYLKQLLEEYPEIEIYLENMFDSGPELLLRISMELCGYKNYGVCLDYAHAAISKTKTAVWVEKLIPYVKHIHINDNDLERDLHWPIGTGEINWSRFVERYLRYFTGCSVLIENTVPKAQRQSLDYLMQRFPGFISGKQDGESLIHTGGSIMEEHRFLNAEELLEQIFYYMNQLVNEKDFSSTVVLLTDLGRTLVNADRASLWYWDKKRKQYWTIAASGSERICVPEGSGIVGATIQNNETIVINRPYEDERFNPQVDRETGYVTKSILCMPVTNAKGAVIGAYQAINKLDQDGESIFDERDVKRLTMASVYCGKTLESHLLYQESRVDPLTGLKNRRGYYEYYSDVVLPKYAEGNCASLIMCDIDFFKKVNDTYGHNAGDAVLEYVAAMLKENITPVGEAFRWGGEEFVSLLPGMDLEQAGTLAEQMRRQIEDAVCEYEDVNGIKEIKITMSFGVSEWLWGKSSDENVEMADAKLYQAKQTGRNKVVK